MVSTRGFPNTPLRSDPCRVAGILPEANRPLWAGFPAARSRAGVLCASGRPETRRAARRANSSLATQRPSAGRLAAAIDWPTRRLFSSGSWMLTRARQLRELRRQHRLRALEDQRPPPSRSHAAENQHVLQIVEVGVVRDGVPEVDADALPDFVAPSWPGSRYPCTCFSFSALVASAAARCRPSAPGGRHTAARSTASPRPSRPTTRPLPRSGCSPPARTPARSASR